MPTGPPLSDLVLPIYDENPAIPSMGDVAYTIQLPKPFGGSRRTSLITALVLVDLRQDIWKQAFGDVE